jgi:predicted kinase
LDHLTAASGIPVAPEETIYAACVLRPTVYLLTGLPGSGKSTYARALERTGVTRLSLDELMHARHGRPGKDYPGHLQPELEQPLLAEVRAELARLVAAGTDVVLDHGLGTRAARDEYKQLVTDAGGRWRLIHFQVDADELRRRVARRNADPAWGIMPEAVLAWMERHADPPLGEGEEPPA